MTPNGSVKSFIKSRTNKYFAKGGGKPYIIQLNGNKQIK